MTDSICECGDNWSLWHFAPNDRSVILGRKAEGSCGAVHNGVPCPCPAYRHRSGPVPKPRPQPSAETIARVRAPRPVYVRPVAPPKPVPSGRRNTYSDERDVPV